RAVAVVLGIGLARAVRVVAGIFGQREHLARAGVVDYGAATGGAPLLDGAGDDLLRLPLQVAVDREHHVAAVDGSGGLLLAGGDDLALSTALVGGLPVRAAQLLVAGELGARQRGAVGADEAEDVPADGAGRVEAIRHPVRTDPGDPQRDRGVAHLRLDVLAQVGEAGVAGEGLLRLRDAPAEHGR